MSWGAINQPAIGESPNEGSKQGFRCRWELIKRSIQSRAKQTECLFIQILWF